jgi:hypothetical protein
MIGSKPAVSYLIRGVSGLNAEKMKAALPRAWKGQIEVTENSVLLQRPYSLQPPTSEQVAETFKQLSDAVCSIESPPPERCESSLSTSSCPTLHLIGSFPSKADSSFSRNRMARWQTWSGMTITSVALTAP